MAYLNKLTIQELHEGLKKKKFSSVEITKDCIDKIEKRQKNINAFITFTKDSALKMAEKADKKIKDNESFNVLHGIPCAIKDNILIKDILCTSGSKILSNYKAPYNAHVIEKLNKQGYVLLGKTNMDEFAMGSSTESSYYGTVKNPHDLERVPGGSSGGSAAAVADEQCIYSLGSDTGGSIRQPAALCGVIGLKPTYGRISRYGLMALASSFDQIGPFAKTTQDAAYIFNYLFGYDQKDGTSHYSAKKEYFTKIKKDVKGLKIGYYPDMLLDHMDEDIKTAFHKSLSALEKQGAEIIQVDMPTLSYALAAYYIILPAEASSNLARYDGVRFGHHIEMNNLIDTYLKTRGDGFGNEVKRRIILGTYTLSEGYYDAYYKKALKVRSILINDYKELFKKVDCFATPTTPAVAFKIGLKVNDPLTMYLEDIFTVSANVAGIPGISIPCGNSQKNLPIGIQFLANHFDEKTLFQIANTFESLNKE